MKHYIYIKTKVRNKFKMLVKLYKNNINVFDIYEKDDYCFLKIRKEDYKKLKKAIVTIKFTYVRDSGIFYLKNVITPLKILIIILFLFLINFFSKIIISVDVIHSNKDIRNMVENALDDYGIRRYSLKKDYDELNKIKNDILANNKDKLEWLEIENVGMKYIIRIEERIINSEEQELESCHIVAKKSGIVENILSTKGEVLVHEGSYVKEGDILISGEIKYNEELKNTVCAKGNVFAEVWYTTTVHLPLNYETAIRTGKKRINFAIDTGAKKYKILRSRLISYETEEKNIFNFLNITLIKLTEYEVIKNEQQYSLEEGEIKALSLADEKIKSMLKESEYIKAQKVLKKSLNDSTIDIEIFYSVVEDISSREEFQKINIEEGS